MTGSSFDLEQPELFTTGAIGPKGQRVFYLQAREGGLLVTLKLEKQQVGALADYLEQMLEDLPGAAPAPASPPLLVDPGTADWVVGGLGVAYDERLDRIVLIAEELLDTDEDDDELDVAPAVARFHLRREQVMAFIPHARDIVAAGRPPCPYCGRPLDVTTGFCPCVN
jgi:uncharacterized repeat protein (TIGR03847 family)